MENETLYDVIEDTVISMGRYTENCIRFYIKGVITLDEMNAMIKTNLNDKVGAIKLIYESEVK